MHVLIPAGGKGTRLRPLTDELPKPLLPLGDQPILTRVVSGIPESVPVTILVTESLEPLFQSWKAELHPRRDVRIYVEPVREQPAGPVTALAECVRDLGIREDVLVMMGDSVHPFHWREFLDARTPDCAHVGAFQLQHLSEASRFGVVEFDGDRVLKSFEEKPAEPRSRWIFTGCLHLPQRLTRQLPELSARRLPQMGQLVAEYLAMGERVTVFPLQGEWHDIGTFESYLEAHQSEMPAGETERLRRLGNRLEGVVYAHPSASILGCKLRNCVISDNAVLRNADLTNCVIRANSVITNRVIQSKLVSAAGEQSLGRGERH